jgi:hypothetical protein
MDSIVDRRTSPTTDFGKGQVVLAVAGCPSSLQLVLVAILRLYTTNVKRTRKNFPHITDLTIYDHIP